MDENVLQAGLRSFPGQLFFIEKRRNRLLQRRLVLAGDMQRVAEGGDMRHAWPAVQPGGELGELSGGPGHRPADEGKEVQYLVRRAGSEQLAVGDVGEAVAALGLVHVVRG